MNFAKEGDELVPGLHINSEPNEVSDLFATVTIDKTGRHKITIKHLQIIMGKVVRSVKYTRPHLN